MGMASIRNYISKMNIMPLASRFVFGSVVYEPGGSLGPRQQSNIQLVLLHRGCVEIDIDGSHRRIEAGAMTLLLPGHTERFRFDREEESQHTWIHGEMPDLPLEKRSWLETAPAAVSITPRIEELMRLGLDLRGEARRDLLPRLLSDQLGAALFLEFLLAAGMQPEQTTPRPEAVQTALQIIGQEYASALDLPLLAKRSGVSPQHLMRLFQKHVGCSPIRFLWQTRTHEAERMLAETGLSVSEIADRCGFQNVFHLSRLIRKRTGRSPTRLRNDSWVPSRNS